MTHDQLSLRIASKVVGAAYASGLMNWVEPVSSLTRARRAHILLLEEWSRVYLDSTSSKYVRELAVDQLERLLGIEEDIG